MSNVRDTDPQNGSEDAQLAWLLAHERPVPAARFRGELGARLAQDDPGYRPRPPRLLAIVALYLAAGGLLMLLALVEGLRPL